MLLIVQKIKKNCIYFRKAIETERALVSSVYKEKGSHIYRTPTGRFVRVISCKFNMAVPL